jgi:hypothetical protein
MLTPERIRAILTACDGSRKDAAKKLGVSPDNLRVHIRRYRDQGEIFPEPENEISRAAKFYGLIQPGQWVEFGKTQDLGEVLEIRYGKALVRFDGGVEQWIGKRQLAWVPSGDVIADETRKIREKWPEAEFYKRAPWALRRVYEIPQVELEDDSRSAEW